LSYIVIGEITTSLLANNIFLQKLFNGSDLDVYDFLDIHIEKQTLSMLDYLPYDITEIILKKCGYYSCSQKIMQQHTRRHYFKTPKF
jgi:hypothetical protein